MKVFTCTGFKGHWPVGTAAVVVAPTVEDAQLLLYDALVKQGIEQPVTREQLVELEITQPRAVVLCAGEY